jgi:hypothetical protein
MNTWKNFKTDPPPYEDRGGDKFTDYFLFCEKNKNRSEFVVASHEINKDCNGREYTSWNVTGVSGWEWEPTIGDDPTSEIYWTELPEEPK